MVATLCQTISYVNRTLGGVNLTLAAWRLSAFANPAMGPNQVPARSAAKMATAWAGAEVLTFVPSLSASEIIWQAG